MPRKPPTKYQVRQRQLYQLLGAASITEGLMKSAEKLDSSVAILVSIKRIKQSAAKLAERVRDEMLTNSCEAQASKVDWAKYANRNNNH